MAATFQVNGRVVPKDRLIDISPDRVARIEYTNYRDLRHDAPILNIVLKPAPMGGSVTAYTRDAITTLKSQAKVNGTYNYRKSEFLFDYNYVYRNSPGEITNERNDYIAPDFTISRIGTGLPSSTIDQDHRFMAEYSYVPDNNSIFVLSAQATLHRQRNHDLQSITQRDERDNSELAYDSRNSRHYWRTPYSLGAFYKRKAGQRVLELSSSVSRSYGIYQRELSYSDGYAFQSNSENNGTSARVDVDYQAPLRPNLDFNVGTYYVYNESSSDLVQDGQSESDSKLTKHEVFVYGSLAWENRGFAINGGPGLRYVALDNGFETEKYFRCRGRVSASQRVGDKFSFSYNVSFDPFSRHDPTTQQWCNV